ncbi:DUF6891 domain-containing protein [Streptomyces chartreusis]|uniref:DUF6891 domain-containing protein n=1 Tax=Streptomyces chartreusis TaxID=1969 RepID=UPI00364D42D6
MGAPSPCVGPVVSDGCHRGRLDAAGLSTQWDWSPGTSISVTPLDWRRRLEA